MKFINYLKSIDGVQVYPLISLLIFVVFFVMVALYVFNTPKAYMKDQGDIPLKP